MKVSDLIKKEADWARRDFKRKNSLATTGHSYCLVGAIMECYNGGNNEEGSFEKSPRYTIYEKIRSKIKCDVIMLWNDTASWQEVKSLIEELDL